MKTLLAICIAALGLSAASLNPLKVTLAVPTVVGGVELPPGEVTVQELNAGSANVVLLVRAKTGEQVNVLVNRLTSPGATHSGITMSFQGGRYVMDQVWLNEFEGFQVLRGE
ncbi:MAG TPA: hypothetical protein VG456_06265 [Candidatus Sulfopaludibacter sp.]|jgi:hypothetical protein|nr:hypothetical protein [Candidatus Sulfopaludibacter sp.]